MARIESVTVGDTDAIGSGAYDHIYVGVGGDITIVTRDGGKESPERTTLLKNVPTGKTLYDIDALYVRDTGTTATDLIGWK